MAPSSIDPRSRAGLPALLALGVLGAALALAWVPFVPPAAAPATAPATEFSAGRARAHLEIIARAPRPPGSLAHREVQQYLVAQLREIGLEPSVQTTTAVRGQTSLISVAGTVRNVAARMRGTGGDARALLLVTHYDGVNAGPGASDAGSAVAALLETARALRAGPRLKNDIIFLFTDAEEVGLLGAKAFTESHPWARDVALVLNFEARGTGGPALMFETSRGNGGLVGALDDATDDPVASSLFYDIYRLLPNDTDFTVFRRDGRPGMNFAYIGGMAAYHTRLDDVAAVDLRSVQHQGEYALGLARHFGGGTLALPRRENSVYFNLPLLGLVAYPETWALPLATAIVLLLAVVIGWGVRARRLRLGGAAVAMLGLLGVVLLAPALLYALWQMVAATHAPYAWMPLGETYNGGLYVGAFILLTVALVGWMYRRLRGRRTVAELYAGALLLWSVCLLAATVYLPGGSYLWSWPTLIAIAGLAYLLRSPRDAEPGSRQLLIAGLAAVPAVLVMAPVVWLIYQGITVQMSGVLMALVVLILALAIPYLELAQRAAGARWAAVPALAAAGLLVAAALSAGFDAEHPRPDSLFYVQDVDRRRSVWASSDPRPDAWTARYLGSSPTRAPLRDQFAAVSQPFLQAPAPAAPLPPPRVEFVSQEPRPDGRVVRLRVASRRGADQLWLNVAPGVEIVGATVNGRRISPRLAAREPWSVRYVGAPAEGIEVALRIKGNDELRVQALDRTSGLPDLPFSRRHPRPRETMPTPLFDSLQDATFVAAGLVVPSGEDLAASPPKAAVPSATSQARVGDPPLPSGARIHTGGGR